jgi:hypothetical protein
MSWLPPPEKQAEIQFRFAKFLSYRARMLLIVLFLLGGLALQLLQSMRLGLLLLLIASLLSFVKGYRVVESASGGETWSRVTPDEYARVRQRSEQQKAWDRDWFDITSSWGVLLFLVMAAFCVFVWVALGRVAHPLARFYWLADCVVLLAPHWITGTRRYLKKDKLIIKIELLRQVLEALKAPSDLQVFPMVATRETRGGHATPVDARLLVHVLNAPEWFLGLQVQVAINSVQGTDYPYLYAVLIGRKGGALPAAWARVKQAVADAAVAPASLAPATFLDRLIEKLTGPKMPTFEHSAQEDVDVLVIRQTTTKNSGYTTNPEAAIRIVRIAADAARRILAAA